MGAVSAFFHGLVRRQRPMTNAEAMTRDHQALTEDWQAVFNNNTTTSGETKIKTRTAGYYYDLFR